MLSQYNGVELDKKHQRDNWGKRPLPPESLHYAQMDTHYLPVLRNDLYDELRRQNRLDEAREAFEELRYIEPANLDFDPDGYWRIAHGKGLNRRQMALLRELYLLRESLAERQDTPPFKILGNGPLLELARRAPSTETEMTRIKGITPRWFRQYGKATLAAIEAGHHAPLPRPPSRNRAAPSPVMERYTALREWRKQRASKRGVDSDVIISKSVLWLLAESAPQSLADMQGIAGLGPWRLSNYGAELLEVLQKIS
jgi:ribonuclease D